MNNTNTDDDNDWRPIETAPTDGTVVWLRNEHQSEVKGRAITFRHCFLATVSGLPRRVWFTVGDDAIMVVKPIHWKPIEPETPPQ